MFVRFGKDNGAWYDLWVTKGKKGYYCHANYDREGTSKPVNKFTAIPYGRWNSEPLETEQQAKDLYDQKQLERIQHGYKVTQESNEPPDDFSK